MDGSTDPVASFMKSPLIQWLQLVSKEEQLEFDDLADGCLLNQLMLNIYPQSNCRAAHQKPREDLHLRKQNLQICLDQTKEFYKNVLQNVVVMPLPNIIKILYEPPSAESVTEMERLLVLILGCAVQCEGREVYVETMKQLTYNGMNAMMSHIKLVTNTNKSPAQNVLSTKLEDYEGSDPGGFLEVLLENIVTLASQRDELYQTTLDLSMQIEENDESRSNCSISRHDSINTKQSILAELQEVKSKMRKAELRLDEAHDNNTDLNFQLEEMSVMMKETKKENEQLVMDARSARAYRDENDILKEKANRLQKMELELNSWKDKLKDLEYYKKRVDALREDNKLLHENKTLAEDELERMSSQLDGMVEKDKKIAELRGELNNFRKEEERDKNKIEELTELISKLQMDKMQSLNESGNLAFQLERALTNTAGRPSIQQESDESAQTRLLQLESENKRLTAVNNAYQESLRTNEATQVNMIELEKENQRLNKKLKKFQENIQKEKQSVLDFETVSKDLQAERVRLESALQVSKSTADRKIEELQNDNAELAKEVQILRDRSRSQGDDKQKSLEKDNKVFSELNKELNAKLRKSENDRKELQKTYSQSMSKISAAEKLHKENSKLEKQNLALEKQVKQLEELCSHVETLEQTSSDLSIENRQLKKQTSTLKALTKQLQDLEDDKHSNEQQLGRLKRQNETMKRQLEGMADLQEQNEDYEKRISHLQQTVETLKIKGKQSDKLELTQMELETELERVRSDLNRNKNLLSKRENDYFDLETYNEQICSQLNQLKITVKKHENSEDKSKELEAQTIRLSATNKQLRHELQRARQQTQLKETELQESSSEMTKLRAINKELLSAYDDYDTGSSSSNKKSSTDSRSPLASPSKQSVVHENKLKAENSSSDKFNEVKLIRDYNKVKKDYSDLMDRHQELLNDQQKSAGEGTREIVKIQDRLISTERENATLMSENSTLKESNRETQKTVQNLQSQLKLAEKQVSIQQEKLEAVQKHWSNLQVDNNALQSQCGLLMEQLANNSFDVSNAENDNKQLKHELEKLQGKSSDLEKDYDNVQTCYQRQTIELEQIMDENRGLKDLLRESQVQMSDLKKRSKEAINSESRKIAERDIEDLEAVKVAHEKLNKSYSKLNKEYGELQDEISHVKSVNNQLKLQLAKLSAEGSDIKGHNQQLDITAAKLKNRCDVLTQLKENLEEENRHLVEQVTRLMSQNEDLLLQMLDSKDQIYSEQKQYTERMQEVRRQKEKLEEKIMDIYRTPGYSSPKRKGFGATIKKTFQNLGVKSSSSEHKKRRDTNHSPYNNSSSVNSSSNRTHDTSSDAHNETSRSHQETISTDSGSQGWNMEDVVDMSGRTTPSRAPTTVDKTPTNHETNHHMNSISSNDERPLPQPRTTASSHTYLRSRAMAMSKNKNNNNQPQQRLSTPDLTTRPYPPPSDQRLSTLLGISTPPVNISTHMGPVTSQLSPIHPVRVDVPPDHNPPGYGAHMIRHDVPPPHTTPAPPPPPPPPHISSSATHNNPPPPDLEDRDDLWYEYGCL